MELVLMVSSVGVDDEAPVLKLLVVGRRLEVVEVFLYLYLPPFLVGGLVEVEGVGVVEAWLLEKP